MVAVIEAYKEEGNKMKGKNKELIKQVKVLKDEEKTFVDQATGKVQNQASGLAFAEFTDP